MTAVQDPALDRLADASRRTGRELRAGGTDVMARHRTGRSAGPYLDLHGNDSLRGITWRPDGSARIGAMTTVAELAADQRLQAAYPALTATAGALATPQIRAAATLGGNLLQRNRCWYYRNPGADCFQTGGNGCPARAGVHLYQRPDAPGYTADAPAPDPHGHRASRDLDALQRLPDRPPHVREGRGRVDGALDEGEPRQPYPPEQLLYLLVDGPLCLHTLPPGYGFPASMIAAPAGRPHRLDAPVGRVAILAWENFAVER